MATLATTTKGARVMADISKCVNGCDKQLLCYRWTAEADERQSYSDFKPDKNGVCKNSHRSKAMTKKENNL